MRTDRHLGVALVTGLLLGLGGVGGHPVLEARPVTAGLPGEQLAAVVDPTRTGELTLIFQFPNPNDDQVGQSPVGVPVELRRVSGVDVTTNGGWARISDLTVEEVLALPHDAFDHSRSGVSDSDGVVTFHGLPLGLYAVTPVPDADQTFEPFVITIPMVDPSGSTWRYVLTAHPKVAGPGDDPSEDPDPPTDPADPRDPAKPGEPGEPTEPGDPTGAPTSSPPALPDTDRPVIPGAPGDPGATEGAQPGQQDRPGGGLAATGAAVIGVFVAGAALVILGLVLMRRRNKPS